MFNKTDTLPLKLLDFGKLIKLLSFVCKLLSHKLYRFVGVILSSECISVKKKNPNPICRPKLNLK